MTDSGRSHHTPSIDQAAAVRPGEGIDIARLRDYLRAALPDTGGGEPTVEQFPGGHSNLTYLIRHGDREYVLRRPPHGSKVKSAHDMGREFRVLSHLAPVYSRAPRPVLLCEDESVIGARFYLMQRLEGVILRRDVPAGMTLDPQAARRLCEALVDALAELHAIDYQAIGLGQLGKPEGYVKRQVTGWTERYAAAQTDEIPAMDDLARWLADNLPAPGAPALVHNDFKLDNVILDPGDITRIIGVLDWEMATIGEPLMDLGTTLCYWVQDDDPPLLLSVRFGPTNLPGMMTRAELAERYARASGRDVGNILYYYCFGLFKTAVVAQQIYYRFKQGLTRDPRFGRMILGVRAMAEQALAARERGRL